MRSLDLLLCLSLTEELKKKAGGLREIFLSLGPVRRGRLRAKQCTVEAEEEEEEARMMMESRRLLTMGGVILHKVFGLLCCDHIDVTHLVSEFDTVELVRGLEQLGPEGGGDELGVACQLHDHV